MITAVFCGNHTAFAQWTEAQGPTAVEFSTNAGRIENLAAPRPGHGAVIVYPRSAGSPLPNASADGATTFDPGIDAAGAAHSRLFEHLLLSGIADLVRGDPAGAADIFDVTAQVADDMPQMQYLLASARVLSDFEHRDRMLPIIRRILAADPDQPLYAIIAVLADPNLSTLRLDGALYFTRDGARRLSAAAAKLSTRKEDYNGKYLALLLGSLEGTDDPVAPRRFNGFAKLLGQGRTIVLPDVAAPQALGRLLVLSIPPEALVRYEARFLTGAPAGREAAAPANADQRRLAASASRTVASR